MPHSSRLLPGTWLVLLALASPARALCPNGIVEPPEQCDDGNTIPGDGCSPLCLLETPNRPPVCDGAFARPESLWPPNHKLVPITIGGVSDPDGDAVAITVTGVSQDEPVDAAGDGDTCPDAVGVGTDVASVRAERSGSGDGRVYHIAFRADDPRGGSCVGEVEVCVRHDNGHGGACHDGGPLFDSTGACAPHDGECELEDCLPPSPIIVGSCEAPLPPIIVRRMERARRLLERAAGAPARRQRRLAHAAEVRLAHLTAVVHRRLHGTCALQVEDVLEHASQCAVCPLAPPVDDGRRGRDD